MTNETPSPYAKAIEAAREVLTKNNLNGPIAFGGPLFGANCPQGYEGVFSFVHGVFRSPNPVVLLSVNGNVSKFTNALRIDSITFDRLIELSSDDAFCFDCLTIISALVLSADVYLDGMVSPHAPPKNLSMWAADCLTGQKKRPKQSRLKTDNLARNYQIEMAVKAAISEGSLRPTRGDSNHPTSACDAVAEVLQELRLESRTGPATYSSVKEIWTNRGRRNSIWRELDRLNLAHDN